MTAPLSTGFGPAVCLDPVDKRTTSILPGQCCSHQLSIPAIGGRRSLTVTVIMVHLPVSLYSKSTPPTHLVKHVHCIRAEWDDG
jgi:hypothetical protein